VKTWLNRMILNSNGRPFSSEESERIAEFAESLPDRLAAAKKLEEAHKWLGKQLTDFVAQRSESWGLPKDPFTTDFVQLQTAISQALLCDDTELLHDSVIEPLQHMSDALDLPARDFGELFEATWNLLSKKLDPRSTALLMPLYTYVIRQLKDDTVGVSIDTPAPVLNAETLMI